MTRMAAGLLWGRDLFGFRLSEFDRGVPGRSMQLRPFGLAGSAGLWHLKSMGAGSYASGRSAGNTQDNTL
jgi:hypothetical protein